MSDPPVNVFGVTVTGDTRKESAKKAYDNPNEGNKQDEATEYLKKQKETWGARVVTLCMFYNATGENLEFYKPNSRNGVVGPNGYPKTVNNGQWGAFSLGQKSSADAPRSVGYVVYNGQYTDTEYCKQLFGWETREGAPKNLVYCDILDDSVTIDPGTIYNDMEALKESYYVLKKMTMCTTTSIDHSGTAPLYKAMLTTEDAVKKNAEGVEASST